jgi:hypothetical protein
MIFTTLHPGDFGAFVNALIERLFNLQWTLAKKLELVSSVEHEAWQKNFADVHRKFCFYTRTDKSVQAHVNEVSRNFVWQLEMQGSGLPDSHEGCAAFDTSFNDGLRSTRDCREYFCPDEAMLFRWLEVYGGWTPDGLTRLRATIAATLARGFPHRRFGGEFPDVSMH